MKSLFVLLVVVAMTQALAVKPRLQKPVPPYMTVDATKLVENTERIIGGEQSEPHRFPWQVAVWMDNSYFCGGSIINDQWILTAGHCVDLQFSTWDVVLGAHTSNKNDLTDGKIIVRAEKSFLHAGYNDGNLHNDIGLLKLSTPITFSPTVQPISALDTANATHVGSEALVSGWGKTSDSIFGGISPVLKFVNLTVSDVSVCNETYGDVGYTGLVCVATVPGTTTGASTCNGDSGGPLSIWDAEINNFRQIGVVSFGASDGCTLGYPVGFSSVAYHRSWIDLVIRSN